MAGRDLPSRPLPAFLIVPPSIGCAPRRGLAVPIGFQAEPEESSDPDYMRARHVQGSANGSRPDNWRIDLEGNFRAR